jgi:hypothetical protein
MSGVLPPNSKGTSDSAGLERPSFREDIVKLLTDEGKYNMRSELGPALGDTEDDVDTTDLVDGEREGFEPFGTDCFLFFSIFMSGRGFGGSPNTLMPPYIETGDGGLGFDDVDEASEDAEHGRSDGA